MEPIRFALLGLGAGAAYALISQGLVLIYRGAGIVNFAQGAIGMTGAFLYFDLHDVHGWPMALAFLVSICVSAAIGASVHGFVMRPLAQASPVVRLISTLAVLVLLLSLVRRFNNLGSLHPVLPAGSIAVLPNARVGTDRLILLAIAVAVTIVLTLIYQRTRFGLATSAVSENARSAGTLGINPNVIATVNWAVASALAAFGTTLIASLGVAFDPAGLSLLIIPALAAALAGGFRSFPLALVGALSIGVAQSEIGRYISAPGWAEAGPFAVIIVVLVLRGRPLPIRGELSARMPGLGSGRTTHPVTVVAAVALGLAAVSLFSLSWVDAVTTTALAAILIVSLVVVTGLTGQLSLAQYALAGMGAWATAVLVARHGFSFEFAAPVGVAFTMLIGMAIGLTALRSRGVNLAIATLGFALVIEKVVLLNPSYTGGQAGLQVGNLSIFGVKFDAFDHPRRFAALVVLTLAVLIWLIATLRRSAAGRRLIAVRANERAAASVGVNILAAKVYAFALSSAIAAIAGILMAFEYPTAVLDGFTTFNSISAVMQAVVGGVGHVSGAPIGATLQPGSVGDRITGTIISGDSGMFVLQLFGALGALYILVRHPDGLAGRRKPLARFRRSRPPNAATQLGPAAGTRDLSPVRAATLELRGLTVTFGGSYAVSDASFRVSAGEVVGIVGPNGSGKTTLIDAVTGFVAMKSGSILLNGVDISRSNATRRSRAGVSRTFQGLELFVDMTVADNLRVASEPQKWQSYLTSLLPSRPRGLSDTAAAIASALDLADDLERTPDQLSFGRRRLVAIARAVAARPSVLLLDEPAAGLGPADTRELALLLRRLADEMGLAIILVEHDVGLIAEVCDRLVVLDRGSVIATGLPQDVLGLPEVERAYFGITEDADSPGLAASSPASTPGKAQFSSSLGDRSAAQRSGSPVLATAGLVCGYGALAAVRELDITVEAGEVVALLGPNGAGKTTTLLTLAGALKPLAGTVCWEGNPTTESLHARAGRGLAFVTEERSVFANLTSRDNLRLGRGEESAALNLFPELQPLLGRKGGLLSGGEQQMLALARALASDPKVLLADELSLGLAPGIVSRLFQAVQASARAGAAVIIVEQYTQRALEIADRVYVLNRGQVVLEAGARELRDDPDRLRAAYLGAASPSPAMGRSS